MVRKTVLCMAMAMAVSESARADIIGFGGNGSGYALNTGGSNTGPTVNNDVLTLTDQHVNEANTAFNQVLQGYAVGFTASFTYTDVTSGGADGFVFVLQNDPRGSGAAGGNGGSMGYAGGSDRITPSLGISFNIYGGYSGSKSGINDSGNIWNQPTGSVNITNGTPVNVVISYDAQNTTVFETLTQGSNTFSQSRTIDLSSTLGNGGDAFVGFTGGTGDTGSVQTISNFSYAEVPEPGMAGMLGLSAMFFMGKRRRAHAAAAAPRTFSGQ